MQDAVRAELHLKGRKRPFFVVYSKNSLNVYTATAKAISMVTKLNKSS